jgi:hypothetical protein
LQRVTEWPVRRKESASLEDIAGVEVRVMKG